MPGSLQRMVRRRWHCLVSRPIVEAPGLGIDPNSWGVAGLLSCENALSDRCVIEPRDGSEITRNADGAGEVLGLITLRNGVGRVIPSECGCNRRLAVSRRRVETDDILEWRSEILKDRVVDVVSGGWERKISFSEALRLGQGQGAVVSSDTGAARGEPHGQE